MKRFCWQLLILFPTFCFGHQDPPGEIHPTVVTVDGQFHILFGDMIQSEGNSREFNYANFKKIYSRDGKIQGSRIRLKREEYLEYLGFPGIELEEELRGRFQKYKESVYVVPEWRRKHEGKPFYLIVKDKEITKKTLNWGEFTIDIVEDFAVTEDSLIVIATVIGEVDEGQILAETDLWIFHFNKRNGEMLFSRKVGDPTFIYSFPGVSNIIHHDGTVYFVWNQAAEEEDGIKLRLVEYRISKGKYNDTLLPYESTWNISISVGANDNLLCLAYHGIRPEISVEFIQINTEQNAAANYAPSPES